MKSFSFKKPRLLFVSLAGIGALASTAVFASPLPQALANAPTDWAAVGLIAAFALLLGGIVVSVWRETARQTLPLNSVGATPWSPPRARLRATGSLRKDG